MTREALRFWATAGAVAVGWAVATSALFPYEALGLETGAERGRGWLLTLWTSGVMAICFGVAGMLGYAAPLGFKEAARAARGRIVAPQLRLVAHRHRGDADRNLFPGLGIRVWLRCSGSR
jgi:hypothetical protein